MTLPPEVRDQLVRVFDQTGVLEAVLHVRRSTGASLAEAHAAVQAVLREAGRLRESSRGETSVEVIAVGPFSRAIAPLLDYDEARYEGVPEGVKVVANLFDVYEKTRRPTRSPRVSVPTSGTSIRTRSTPGARTWRPCGALKVETTGGSNGSRACAPRTSGSSSASPRPEARAAPPREPGCPAPWLAWGDGLRQSQRCTSSVTKPFRVEMLRS
ncbi:hypothetical protein ACLESD_03275 [Pyxidicoccus sp. 3LFB2]